MSLNSLINYKDKGRKKNNLTILLKQAKSRLKGNETRNLSELINFNCFFVPH